MSKYVTVELRELEATILQSEVCIKHVVDEHELLMAKVVSE